MTRGRLAWVLAAALTGAAPAAPDPVDPRWIRFEHEGPLLSGAQGGGRQLAWPAAGRIDLATPGSLVLVVEPVRWLRAGPGSAYVPFVAVQGVGGASFLVERDVRAPGRTGEKLFAGFWELPGERRQFLEIDLSDAWQAGEPHTIALSWDATGFSVRVDDGPWRTLAVPGGVVARAFPADRSRLVLGSPNAETTRITRLRVLRRAAHP